MTAPRAIGPDGPATPPSPTVQADRVSNAAQATLQRMAAYASRPEFRKQLMIVALGATLGALSGFFIMGGPITLDSLPRDIASLAGITTLGGLLLWLNLKPSTPNSRTGEEPTS